ncbi:MULTISPECIES: HdeD family acid-resistance protein [unclassified Shimia]|uniref:HdeD family acid-resistance protein n=1 Tax=unclassified Shimia TaxID=2630038 RepID=UPI00310A74ED
MNNWIILMIVGVVSVVLGLVALVYPFAASVTATLFVAWSFVIMGGVQIFAAFSSESTGAKIAGVLIGLLAMIIGVHILAEPLKGLLSLTLVSGILFLVSGAFKAGFGLFNVQGTARLAMLLSAVVSIVLGLMVLNNFPQSAAVLLGVLLAVELLSTGISAIALGWAVRDMDDNAEAA